MAGSRKHAQREHGVDVQSEEGTRGPDDPEEADQRAGQAIGRAEHRGLKTDRPDPRSNPALDPRLNSRESRRQQEQHRHEEQRGQSERAHADHQREYARLSPTIFDGLADHPHVILREGLARPPLREGVLLGDRHDHQVACDNVARRPGVHDGHGIDADAHVVGQSGDPRGDHARAVIWRERDHPGAHREQRLAIQHDRTRGLGGRERELAQTEEKEWRDDSECARDHGPPPSGPRRYTRGVDLFQLLPRGW